MAAVAALLEARLGTAPEVSAESGTVSAAVENGRLLPEIVRELDAASIELAEFALRKASLDEVFLALTGQPADRAPSRLANARTAGTERERPMTCCRSLPPRPAPARRLGPLGGLRNSFTLTWRSLLKMPTNIEDLFSLSLTPIVYLLLFTYVFGGAVSGSTHKYLQFSLPGVLVMSVVFATMGTGMMLNADITTGVFDRFRSLPIARWAPLAGAICGDAIRYVISIAVTLGFGFILGFRIEATPFSAAMGCLLLLVFALAMCWFSALIGVLMRSPQAVQGFGFLLMFPLVFGSNLLVPTATLPGWLQAFVKVNPITYLTEAERALLTGGPAAGLVERSLLLDARDLRGVRAARGRGLPPPDVIFTAHAAGNSEFKVSQ